MVDVISRTYSSCEERETSDSYKMKTILPTVELDPPIFRSKSGALPVTLMLICSVKFKRTFI